MIELSSSDLENKLIQYGLKLKTFSDCYKKILVDEIFFTNELHNLHYGNCAVIGKIDINSDDEKYLENIRLNFLGNRHSLPEGCIKIRMLDNLFYGSLPHGKTVEVFGRIVLCDMENPVNNRVPIDAKDINIRLIHSLENNVSVSNSVDYSKLISKFNIKARKLYEPAIQIRFFNLIDQAEDLIECNLVLRTLHDL